MRIKFLENIHYPMRNIEYSKAPLKPELNDGRWGRWRWGLSGFVTFLPMAAQKDWNDTP